MEEMKEYDHQEKNTGGFFDFPLDHQKIELNKSIENPEEFKKFMEILLGHKNSSST